MCIRDRVYGENAMSRLMIAKWCQMFEDGRTNVTDGLRVGQPSTVNTSDNAGRVNEIILANRCVKIKEIASELNIAYGSASVLIHDQLGYRKVCARWVLRVLSDTHKNQRFEAVLSFLQRYSTDGPQSVSYTHLDVYKRQAQMHYRRRCSVHLQSL